jgi:hypothetical protein
MSLSTQGKVGSEVSTDVSSLVPDEFNLVLAFLRDCDSYATTRLKTLGTAEVNWARVVQVARKHRVIPWVARYLQRFPDGVPDGIIEGLHRLSKQIAMRSLLLTGELFRVLDLMAESGIQAIPFKGPALGALCYGDLSLRECDDIDVLVPAEDVARATELLLTKGYEFLTPCSESDQQHLMRTGWAFTFVHERTRLHLDLHWRFTASGFSFPFDVERLWSRLKPLQLAGRQVLSFQPQDALLLHCVHGAKHQWVRLEWVYALAGFLRSNPDLDWEDVLRQASSLRAERMLFLGLRLASDLFGAPIPPQITRRIELDATISTLVSLVHMGLVSEEETPVQEAHQYAFHLRMRESWRDRVRYFIYRISREMTPTAMDRATIPLPTVLSGLYYLTRPFRLLNTYGLTPLKQFFRLLRSG